ncbi:magnesium transporter MgtE [Methylopila jiangsuensis]|uniref:Magnesium transporter MgtE n=1 Tax=Methylopila jiangsuensis TaxID=586230 RepID=A0A9W6N2K1_9HYPH|nr:magnesium transporter [Methylopila jiangsuensis]MDR6285610.1 magnesium transporter [Methylopila jiangsuensis]GLK75370.1 magnesium transporter MgtE [Methylopila jiangsuensis]
MSADAETRHATQGADLAAPIRDEDGRLFHAFVEAVAEAIAANDGGRVCELAGDLHESDVGDLIENLEPDDRPKLIELLGKEFDFAALTEVDETVRVRLLEELPSATIVEGVRELDSDDAVYILEDLDEAERARILDQLPAPDRVALTRSLDFPEESAGRRMQTAFVATPPFWTVGHVIDHIADTPGLPETFYEVFVIDPAFKLLGSVKLDRLLRTRRSTLMRDILEELPRTVRATDDQEQAARLFERYNLVSAAVVDDADRLVGVLMVDDILDVIEEEADEDLRALGGVTGDEEISDTVLYTARSRIPWLLVNLCTAFFSASVIGLFEGTIEHMVALAVLMPIVASMGGNAGTQTMTVAVRALATRDLGGHNARRLVRREALVGLANGVTLALLVGLTAGTWFENPELGVIIGTAMVVNLVCAGLFGILIPLTLDKLKADPAVASGVFLTTVTDTVGFFAFLGLAAWWFNLH